MTLVVTQRGAAMMVREYSTATGRVLRTIPIGPASGQDGTYFCGVLWSGSDGSDLLTRCQTGRQEVRQQQVVRGKITPATLARLWPATVQLGYSNFAW